MPRPKRESTIGVEAHIADVISSRLKQLKWSYYQLAAAMKREGCDIAASSLRQSVVARPNSKGVPCLRPMKVDELVALSRVFALPLDRLVQGKDWVDGEQVEKAMQDLNRANGLLIAAVRTTLEAEIALMRATTSPSPDTQRRVVDEPNRQWRASTRRMRLGTTAADAYSPNISAEAVSDLLSDLKGVIAAMALDWCERDDQERMLQHHAKPIPKRPAVGSREWRSHLEIALMYHDDPDPDEPIPTEYRPASRIAERMAAQDPARG